MRALIIIIRLLPSILIIGYGWLANVSQYTVNGCVVYQLRHARLDQAEHSDVNAYDMYQSNGWSPRWRRSGVIAVVTLEEECYLSDYSNGSWTIKK